LWTTDQALKDFKEALRPPRKLLYFPNSSCVFENCGVNTQKYITRSVIVNLNQDWFTDDAITYHDVDILDMENPSIDPKFNEKTNKLALDVEKCLKKVHTLYNPTTLYVIVNAHKIFENAIYTCCNFNDYVPINLNPVNTTKFDEHKDEDSKQKRLVTLCKRSLAWHHRDCGSVTFTNTSPNQAIDVDDL